jgi:hypothetical protein
MTKRRLTKPKRTEPEAPKGPSVGLILGCALATGVGLGEKWQGLEGARDPHPFTGRA